MDSKGQEGCTIKSKCYVSKILILATILLFIICSIIAFVLYHYHKDMNQNFNQAMSQIAENLSNIKMAVSNNREKIFIEQVTQTTHDHNKNEYYDFLRHYYETQNNWLNMWLTISALVLGFLGLIVPLCFLKFYESKKEEFNIVIREVEKKKETITKDLEEVKNYVNKAQESEKKTETNRLFVSSLRAAAQKKYQEALRLINLALDLSPKNLNCMRCKADILQELEKNDEAIALYEKVISQQPTMEVYNNLGNSLMSLNKKEQAITAFTKAINLSTKDDYRLFSNRATAFMLSNDLEKALKDFKAALKCIPEQESHTPIFYNITECYLLSKNFSQALFYLKHFMDSSDKGYIYDDDKKKWLSCLTNDLDKKEVLEIAKLINDLSIKKRNEKI